MLEAMLEGWRGKRVLIVGKPDGLCAFLTAMLEEIGARLMRVGDRADAQALCRALTAGRIGAVILPEEMTGRDLPERLAATLTLIQEIREAGVPLLLALSDAWAQIRGNLENQDSKTALSAQLKLEGIGLFGRMIALRQGMGA